MKSNQQNQQQTAISINVADGSNKRWSYLGKNVANILTHVENRLLCQSASNLNVMLVFEVSGFLTSVFLMSVGLYGDMYDA